MKQLELIKASIGESSRNKTDNTLAKKFISIEHSPTV